MKKCFDTNKYVNLALLQIRSTLTGHGLLSSATVLFKRPVRCLLPEINRLPKLYNFDNHHCDASKQRQHWVHKHDTHIDFNIIPEKSTVVVQREDGGPWKHGTVVEHGINEYNSRSYKIT